MRHTYIALAPIRICDLGGWSDTWFARHGAVLNVAVSPYVECRLEVREAPAGHDRFFITVDDYGDRYRLDPRNVEFGRHPLLDACVKSMEVPRGLDVEVSLHSSVPGGSSTGTSAAVTVALIGALDCLTPGRLTADEVAKKAHEVETIHLGQQSGIQDQLCAAHGGFSFIDMDDYPHATVTRVPVADQVRHELESRMSLVFLGHTHNSSTVHENVIKNLLESKELDRLEPLRQEARIGRDALAAGDLAAFGASMIRNTEAQSALHPALVSFTARYIFDIAKRHGALGWKVNGAGGEGGSVTLLGSEDPEQRRQMMQEIAAMGGGVREIGIRLDDAGLRRIEA